MGPLPSIVSGGTYTLVVELPEDASLTVGSLGEVAFPSGWYAYTGSACGPGGFARVERHERVATGRSDTRHWHVDYLLGHEATSVDQVITTPGAAVECVVASRLGSAVPGFGSSDCACRSHLAYGERRDELLAAVDRAHRDVA